MKRTFLCILLLLVAVQPASAFSLSGYAKNLSLNAKSSFTGKEYFFNISRLRLKGLLDMGGSFHSEIWLDTEVLAGNYLSTQDYETGKTLEPETYLDLTWTVSEGKNHNFQQRLFRAFLTFYTGNVQTTLGRQRIAWGTGFVWNPTDLLNPASPLAVEREEKQGVDAIYAAVALGDLSRAEAAFAPGNPKSSSALRMSSNMSGYDFSVMAGDFQGITVLGGDFAGYIKGAGFRGEFAYTFREQNRDFLSAVLNVDYNFSHGHYTMLEYYYTGQDTAYHGLRPGRHYLATQMGKDLTPLLRLDLYGIAGMDDGSGLLGPSITYSLTTNLEAAAGGYFFSSDSNANIYFASLQYFF